MSIYLHYDGIKGNATQGQHKDWININSFQWGVGRGISTAVGRAQNRETSEPSISEVVVSKELDAASAMLLQEAMIGKDGKTVKIDFCRTDK
jgi:type VI secretion system secreted protein Hcp